MHRILRWLLVLFLLGSPAAAETARGKVSWIYDGDTIKVEGVGKVRLVGIDTPEKEPSSRDDYYRRSFRIDPVTLRRIAGEAQSFNMTLAKGRLVTLEFDHEQRDSYGRALAYVTLPDGRNLNRLLLEHGLATVYRRFDFRQKEDFLQAEKSARDQKIGLWHKE